MRPAYNRALTRGPRGRTITRTPTSGGTPLNRGVYLVKVSEIWKYIRRQPASFWFLNMYMLFEYVRPQQIYRQIDVLPWAWTCILLALVAFTFEGFKLRRSYPADRMLAAFTAMVLVSSVCAVWPSESFQEFGLFFDWLLIYALITNIINTQERFLVFMLAFLLYSTKMSQHGTRSFAERDGGFASWGATGAPGWFHNSGEFGIQMCVFFPLSVYFISSLRKSWPFWKVLLFLFMPVSTVISIVASSSRGALIGIMPVLFWMILKSRRRFVGLLLAGIVAVGIWFILPPEQKGRFDSIGEDDSSISRLVYWKRGIEMTNKYPLTGVGYRNWLRYTGSHYPPLYGLGGQPMVQLPHNIFIEASAELGYTGLFLFFGLIGMTLYTNQRTRKLAKSRSDGGGFAIAMAHGLDAAMIGFLGSGFFVTVLYYPFFWINYAMTVALYHIVVRESHAPAAAFPARPPVGNGYGRG